MRPPGFILIRGAGELATGVAHRLFRCGYRVVMTEVPQPLAVRRLVCFSEALAWGRWEVEGVVAEAADARTVEFGSAGVAVIVDPDARVLERLTPDAIVDARMRKKQPRPVRNWRGTLIGLGPGFRAPQDSTFVVETHRGARLGEVLASGEAAADTGIPGVVAGESIRRVVHAPSAGRFTPLVKIGDLVVQGQPLGTVSDVSVLSTLSGMVRGLLAEGTELFTGVKVADIDPRGVAVDPTRMTDKALAVAGGVLEALLRAGQLPDVGPR